MFCDAHFHIVQCFASDMAYIPLQNYCACTCAHDIQEFKKQQSLVSSVKNNGGYCDIYQSFGMHPQMPLTENAEFLETCLQNNLLDAIGEAGFDLFSDEYRSTIQEQENAWDIELSLAAAYGKPLVVHCRKGLDRMFRDSARLKKVPAVLFHSFAAGPAEAKAILNHGIHAWFSFAKQLLNGNRHSIACVRELDAAVLLLETDAPFQTLRGEQKTAPEEITRVYDAACEIRGIHSAVKREDAEHFYCQLERNFRMLYGLKPVTGGQARLLLQE